MIRDPAALSSAKFERRLNMGLPLDYTLYGNWLEMALDAGRIDIAFVAYKKGVRLPRKSYGINRTGYFLETQQSLARLIDNRQKEVRALTLEHGTICVTSEHIPKEIIDTIVSYVRASEDVDRIVASMYEREPINQLLILFFFVLLLLYTVSESQANTYI